MRKVNNIPIEQDPETLEGQVQQPANPEDMPTKFIGTDNLEQASQVPEVSKTDEILKRMYAVRDIAPTLDTEKQARLQRMGKVNAIGKGVSLLSDALSLGLGGRVKRRGPDTMAPALFNQYQAMLDKYKNDQDQFSLREIANERNNIRMEYADEKNKEETKYRRELLAAKTQAEKDAATLKFNQKERDLENRRKEHEATLKMGYARIAASSKNKKSSEEKPFKPIEVYDDNGVKVKRSQADWTQDYLKAQTDPDYKANIKALISKYEKTPDGGLMQIANEYYNFKQQQRLSAKNQKSAPIPTSITGIPVPGMPNWTPPAPGTVTGPAVGSHAPKPSKKIDVNALII